MKKVGFLCMAKYPVPAVKGGAVETLVTNLLDENETNHLLDIAVFSFDDADARLKSHSYKHSQFFFVKKTLVFKLVNKLVHFVSQALGREESLYYQIIRKQISQANLDALVLEASTGYAKRLQKDFPQLPLYFHVHNIPEGHYEPAFSSWVKGCLCISKFIQKETERILGFDSGKMHLLYNSVDTELFAPVKSEEQKRKLREKYGFTAKDKIVIYAGRLQAFKGIKQLLEAFVQIEDEDVKLLVVGASFFSASKSTPFIDELKRLSENYKSRITFTGYVSHDKICECYQMADIAVLPSMWEEPFGLTCLEALACGLPVITTKSGGLPEIVTASCGVVLDRDESLVSSIHRTIMTLLENQKLRFQMGEEARKRSLRFDTKAYLKNFANIVTSK